MCRTFLGGPIYWETVIRDIIRNDWTNYRAYPRGMAPIILKNQNGDLEKVEKNLPVVRE